MDQQKYLYCIEVGCKNRLIKPSQLNLHQGHEVMSQELFQKYVKENPHIQEEIKCQGELEDKVTELLDYIQDKIDPIQQELEENNFENIIQMIEKDDIQGLIENQEQLKKLIEFTQPENIQQEMKKYDDLKNVQEQLNVILVDLQKVLQESGVEVTQQEQKIIQQEKIMQIPDQ